jgi:hypothetical protein
LASVALGLSIASPRSAAAQSAWLPGRGDLSVSVTFQRLDFEGHFDENGEKLEDAVPSRAYLGIVQFEYGLSDKFAIDGRLPYVASKFTGHHDEPVTTLLRERYEEFRRTHPDAAVTSLDTGAFYSTFQDLSVALRYNAIDGGLTVTPAIAVTIPTHHYRTVGEAAPGLDRRALTIGVNAGRLLDPWLPNAYLHARYSYSFVQSLLGVPLNRSVAEFEVGYALAPTVAIRGLATWSHTHGGVPFSRAYEDAFLFLAHDRLLASRYWHVGGGATVSLTDAIDLDGGIVTFLSGSDTHYGVGMTAGITWQFLRGRAPQPSMRSGSSQLAFRGR